MSVRRQLSRWVVPIVFLASLALGLTAQQFPVLAIPVQGFFQDRRGTVYGAMLGLFGSLLGFVLATLAIVIGYVHHPRLQVLADSGQLRPLLRLYVSSTRWTAAAALSTMVALLADRDTAPNGLFFSVCGATLLAAVLSVGRLLSVTGRIVNIVADTGPRLPGR